MRAFARLLARALIPPSRPPDFVIGDDYMRRWWLIPRNSVFNVYLHHIRHSDDDRALHDHPWWSVSLCLRGKMVEYRHRMEGVAVAGDYAARKVEVGDVVVRRPKTAHRLVLVGGWTCWTLFITGPRVRDWGFYCPQGWRRWQDYTVPGQPGQRGIGCGEHEG